MGIRRSARESALRILFELEFNDIGLEAVLARYDREHKAPAAVGEYAGRIVRGVMARRDEIDALIQSTSRRWRIARMALVDRNILRIAAFELLEDKTLAPAIIINEAIEIARLYSSEEAAHFVNGVLDAVRKKIEEKITQGNRNNDEQTNKPAKRRSVQPAGQREKK
jgi:N utilization substance protein B